MNQSEPTTGEIVRALRCVAEATECKDCRYKYPVGNVILCDHEQMNANAADRLESQERTIDELEDECGKLMMTIDLLTARAEQAEKERDAAKADMKLIVDAVRETHCDETCCFACKYDCDMSINDSGEFNNECPGFDKDDCFEWRGLPQDGEGV